MLLFTLCLGTFVSNSQAQAMPRIMYVTPDYKGSAEPLSFLGKYWYLGVAFVGAGQELSGPSIRYGFGDTGEKLNFSYFTGSSAMSLEVGVSYIRQDANATLWVNNSREGYALEGAFRYNLISVIAVATETDTTIELAIGF